MRRTTAFLAFFLVILAISYGQTVALVFHAASPSLARSVAEEIQTGALDRLYEEGFIVTSTGSTAVGPPPVLSDLLAEARLGLVDWLLVLELPEVAEAKAGEGPSRLDYSLVRVGDGSVLAKGEALAPKASDPGFADPERRLRALGEVAAKAALLALGRLFFDSGVGGLELSWNGG